MEYSINIDWIEELNGENFEKWENLGQNAVSNACKHFDESEHDNNLSYSGYCEKCDVSTDSLNPMMNYGYLIQTNPSEEQILKVVNNTNLTLMENTKTNEIFLVLTGGGMDLSQDIARAYMLLEEWIPSELAYNVSTQEGLNVSGKTFIDVMNACKKSLNNQVGYYSRQIKQIEESISKATKK